MFIVLLSTIVNASNHTKCVSLSHRKCEIQVTLINLHPNEYSQEFHYYPFLVKLDRCVGNCNTVNDICHKVCIPNKTEDLNLSAFNMITGINESKTLTKHISCACICKFDEAKCKSNQWWNIHKCPCECKKQYICEKDYALNPATCNCENGKYLASIIDDSIITCQEVIKSNEEEIKTIPTNFNENKATCKTQSFYIFLALLLITIALLIAVSIYCYMIKYQTNHLLPFHDIKNLKNIYFDNIN